MINNERLIERFMRYVRINSETGNEKEFSELIVKELESLGLNVRRDKAGDRIGSNSNNIWFNLCSCFSVSLSDFIKSKLLYFLLKKYPKVIGLYSLQLGLYSLKFLTLNSSLSSLYLLKFLVSKVTISFIILS